MLTKLLRSPRADVEIGVAIPIGCLVLLAVAIAVVSSSTLGCSRRNRRTSWSASSTTVRLVDPVVLSTAIVPLR